MVRSLRNSSVMALKGTHRSVGLAGSMPTKPGGVTPTTMWRLRFKVIAAPTIAGAPPKRRCQYWWLSTATGSAPSRSSSARKVRPIAALTPRTSK
jgi:hypothetical protein